MSGETQPGFTPRQKDVLTRLLRGETNKQIGICLGISEKTVKAHLTEVYRTLGVPNRSSAVLELSARQATVKVQQLTSAVIAALEGDIPNISGLRNLIFQAIADALYSKKESSDEY